MCRKSSFFVASYHQSFHYLCNNGNSFVHDILQSCQSSIFLVNSISGNSDIFQVISSTQRSKVCFCFLSSAHKTTSNIRCPDYTCPWVVWLPLTTTDTGFPYTSSVFFSATYLIILQRFLPFLTMHAEEEVFVDQINN